MTFVFAKNSTQDFYTDLSGFGGFKDEADFKKFVNLDNLEKFTGAEKMGIKNLVNAAFEKHKSILKYDCEVDFFIFKYGFMRENVDNVTGYAPWENTVHIYIFQDLTDLSLKNTVAHELTHTYIYQH